jgi:hypothetical protein
MSWSLRDGVSYARTEYGGVLLDLASGEYWTLNHTGAIVLSCLLEGATPEAVPDRLTAQFAADPGEVEQDVPALVAQLREAGLMVLR